MRRVVRVSRCRTSFRTVAPAPGDTVVASGEAQRIAAAADPWADVRAQFVAAPDLVHLSTFYLVAHPRPVREAIQRFRDQLDANPLEVLQQGSVGGENSNLDLRAKRAAARYIDGKAEEIALTQSKTMGLASSTPGSCSRRGKRS